MRPRYYEPDYEALILERQEAEIYGDEIYGERPLPRHRRPDHNPQNPPRRKR